MTSRQEEQKERRELAGSTSATTFHQLANVDVSLGGRFAAGGDVSGAEEVRIPAIVTTNSDGSRPFVPIDRDQCKGAVRCIF